MNWGLRRTCKAVLNAAALVVSLPFGAVCWIESHVDPTAESFFNFCTHVLALVPGLPGVYLRRAFYVLTLERCSFDVSIGFGSFFSHRHARVDDGVRIGAFAVVGMANLGKGVLIGTRASLLSGCTQHERLPDGTWSASDLRTFKRIDIGHHVWIGEAATVMADVGAGTVVAAGAVVSAPIAPDILVGGNPARYVTNSAVPRRTVNVA